MTKFNTDSIRMGIQQSSFDSIAEATSMEVDKMVDLYQGKEKEYMEKSIEGLLEDGQKLVKEYDIAILDDNDHNHFHHMKGEKWDEFVGSIREHGVLTPLIIRSKENGHYEVIAGHNRKRGALEAGLHTVPCITVDVDDIDASVLVGITNEQRDHTTDLEWGWAYRTTYEAIQNSRADHTEDAIISSPESAGETETDPWIRTVDLVAAKYGVGRTTIQRKIRLTYLVSQLYDACAEKQYSQSIMITLSYLPELTQTNVAQMIQIEKVEITQDLAEAIRNESKTKDLSIDDVIAICKAEPDETKEKVKKPKKYEVADILFPPSINKNMRQDYITKALTYIMDHGINLEAETNG